MISLMLHVTAAAILVGPQVLMFLAVTPSTWLIDDEKLKANITHVIARRFGMLASGSLLVLLVTGLYQFYALVPEPIQNEMMDYNFGAIFIVKMTLFTLLVALILVHVGIFSRRVSRLSERVMQDASDEEARYALDAARLQSFTFSLVLLVVSIAILWLGVALGDASYSYQLRG
jgi:uncharacterized membrane protein